MIWASTRRFGVSNGIRSRRRASKSAVAEVAELSAGAAELSAGTEDCFVCAFESRFLCAVAAVADWRLVFGFVALVEPLCGSGLSVERATLAIRTPSRIGGVQRHSNTRAEQRFPLLRATGLGGRRHGQPP